MPGRAHLRDHVRAAVIMIALLGMTAGSAHSSEPTLEYQVKAAFLYKFTKFVEWPPEAFSQADGAFEIGVVGENPFGPYLIESVSGQSVQGHPARVVEFTKPEAVRPCAILFVPSGFAARADAIRSRLGRAPVLLVGESPGFAEQGGIINFVLRENKVRFEVNPSSARDVGLQISSKLLAIATLVGEGGNAEARRAP